MFDEAAIAAFVDGELPPPQARAILEAAENSPELAARIERHQRLKARLATAFSDAFDPAPERLVTALEGPGAEILPFRRRPQARDRSPAVNLRPLARFAPLAACLVAGFIGGALLLPREAALPFRSAAGGLEANGALAALLDRGRVGAPAGGLELGLSFRRADGSYCRTFVLRSAAESGLACRGADGWRIALLAASGAAASGEYRTASSALPVPILGEVERLSAGPALDARQEAEAVRRGWR